MEWQTIESAPKDGSLVLLWSDGMDIGYWVNGMFGTSGWSVGSSDSHPEDGYELWVTPTHWMPLPSPPDLDRKD